MVLNTQLSYSVRTESLHCAVQAFALPCLMTRSQKSAGMLTSIMKTSGYVGLTTHHLHYHMLCDACL